MFDCGCGWDGGMNGHRDRGVMYNVSVFVVFLAEVGRQEKWKDG